MVSLFLGTLSSWAEAMTLEFGIKWCLENDFLSFTAESDSKVLVDSVTQLLGELWMMLMKLLDLKSLQVLIWCTVLGKQTRSQTSSLI